MQETIKFITMKLDENERSTQIRLMKVKDMMLEQTYHYAERAEEQFLAAQAAQAAQTAAQTTV